MQNLKKCSAVLIIIICSLFIATPYWINSFPLPKTEDFEYSIIPTILYSAQLFGNEAVPWWFSKIGLGTPWPTASTITYSPINLLFYLLNPFNAIGWLVFIHSCILGYGAWLFLRSLNFSNLLLNTALVTITLSTAIECLYWSDAILVYATWCVMPLLFYLTRRVLIEKSQYSLVATALAIGILGGYIILNGHLGVLSIYLLGIFFYVCINKNFYNYRFIFLAASGVIATLIGADKLTAIALETTLFDGSIPRAQQALHGGILGILKNAVLRPFFIPTTQDIINFPRLLSHFAEANSFSRTLGYGTVFTALSFFYLFHLFNKKLKLIWSQDLINIAIAYLGTLGFLMLPLSLLPNIFSATWPMRDMAMLYGTPLAVKGLEVLANRFNNPKSRLIFIRSLAYTQLALVMINAIAMVMGPFWIDSRGKVTIGNYENYLGPLGKSAYTEILNHELKNSISGRIVATARASQFMDKEMLADAGATNNFSVLSGFSEVSFIAKGVSFDSIRQAQSIPYGLITGESLVQWRIEDQTKADWAKDDQALISLLGIEIVIAENSEQVSANGLTRIATLKGRDGYTLAFYKNERPLPPAVFVNAEVLDTPLSTKDSCANGLICKNLTKIVESSRSNGLVTIFNNDKIHIKIDEKQANFPLSPILISTMFRPEWRLSPEYKNSAATIENWHGLLLIRPTGSELNLTLQYVPTNRIIARRITVATLFITMLMLIIISTNTIIRKINRG